MGGSPIAKENYSVTKSDGGIDIDGSGSATLGTMKIDIEKFEVFYGHRSTEPEQGMAKAKMGQIQMNVSATFGGGQAKNEIDTGQGPQTKTLAVHSGCHRGECQSAAVSLDHPRHARQSSIPNSPSNSPFMCSDKLKWTASVVFKGREHVDFAGKSAELNHLAVTASTPQGQTISLDFWVDDNRKLIKISVPAQNVEAYQEGFAPKPATAAQSEAPKGN